MPDNNKILSNTKLFVKWIKATGDTLPDIDAGKDAQNYVNQNIATTMGVIAQYLADYKSFKGTGVLPPSQGGTGQSSLDAGKVLIGNGTTGITFRAIEATAPSSASGDADKLITSGAVKSALNALGNVFTLKSVGQYTRETLPTTNNNVGDVHLVRIDDSSDTDDVFAEYVWVIPTGSQAGQWEYLGRLQVDIDTATTSTPGLVTLASSIGESSITPIGSAVTTPNQVESFVAMANSDKISVNDTININCVSGSGSVDGPVRYGIKIDKNDGNPETRVHYMYDAVGFTPAHMVYDRSNPENSYFSYGSWGDAFFVKNNYPCMCLYDGTEDYELNHNDHTKKLDGTASDVANMSYGGNAQSCFNCKIWMKAWEDADYEYYAISNVQYDPDYHINAYVRADGTVADKVYFPMYKGSDDGTRLRSMSGVYPQNMTTSSKEISKCAANGENWQIGDWAHHELLNVLLLLISKSDNTQESFGQGVTIGGSSASDTGWQLNGSLNTKGQFFGYTATTKAVKTFYIENWWGTRQDRCLGLFNDNGEYKVKWTPPYSDTSVTGCIATGVSVPSHKGFQYKTSNLYGRLPISTGSPGSASTYTCDYFWAKNSQLNLAVVGGASNSGAYCGAWFVYVHCPPTVSGWLIGASPYLK